ncbi:LytTR family DNA-binding domain-containing protein [Algoriphagus jejuensis]|uniref:LytTR family DNA-binding domain-containing protein n=1 Tax=Algoriphagus jejuensis TaxID=419934 RepID=A0ABN1N0P2_9BACT
MKILIIEDEKPAANRLERLLSAHFPEVQFGENLDTVTKALRWFGENAAPDLIFCDIQLADGISFEIFEKLKVAAPVIFTTAFDQYAIRAFQVNAIDYLLKPIDPAELARAVDKFKSRQVKQVLDLELLKGLLQPERRVFKNRFLVRFGEKIQSIAVEEVAFFFSEERVTFLQTKEGKKYVLDSTLEQVENQIDPAVFFRINRKYLCRVEAVDEVLTYSNSRLKVKLTNSADSDILISREKVGDFKDWLDR